VDGLCSSVYAANNAILVRTPPPFTAVSSIGPSDCARRNANGVSAPLRFTYVPHLDLVEISMKIAFQRICVLLTLHRFLLRA
jgi:hypothetical protein